MRAARRQKQLSAAEFRADRQDRSGITRHIFGGSFMLVVILSSVSGLAGSWLAATSATFGSTTSFMVVAPGQQLLGTTGAHNSSLVKVALALETIVNRAAPVTRTSSTAATLITQGARHGTTISVPNFGNQWQYSFPRPRLDIQVVGSSKSEVRAARARALDNLHAAMIKLTAMSEASSSPVRLALVPGSGRVGLVAGGGSGRWQAIIAFTISGALLGAALSSLQGSRRETSRSPRRDAQQ